MFKKKAKSRWNWYILQRQFVCSVTLHIIDKTHKMLYLLTRLLIFMFVLPELF